MRIVRLTIIALLASAASLAAQEQELERPSDWAVRFDQPGLPDSAVYLVEMPPGWHVTTGPACILYNPENTASGQYRVEAEINQFDPQGRHREAYGVFIGGKELQTGAQQYVYFLIRNEGSYLVKRRMGSGTQVLIPWTSHGAIQQHPGGDETASSTNVLTVEVGADSITFLINGEQATEVPRGNLETDGIVGLRVNHALNLHVSRLDVTPKSG